MVLEDYFAGNDEKTKHPFLRYVKKWIDSGYSAVFELNRPRQMLGYGKATISVCLSKEGFPPMDKSYDWDDDLNTELIKLKIKSRTAEEEKDRFALKLRAAFRKPEKRYGDGYFNSVLKQFVLQSPFKDRNEIAEVLRHIPVNLPYEGKSHAECIEMIDAAIAGRALELHGNLEYNIREALDILVGALARYLDERFSVTSRRLLNML